MIRRYENKEFDIRLIILIFYLSSLEFATWLITHKLI